MAQMVVAADDRALEQAPDAFHAVSMHVTAYPYFSPMVDGFMDYVLVGKVAVGRPLVSIDCHALIGSDGVTDERVENKTCAWGKRVRPSRTAIGSSRRGCGGSLDDSRESGC